VNNITTSAMNEARAQRRTIKEAERNEAARQKDLVRVVRVAERCGRVAVAVERAVVVDGHVAA